MYNFTLKRVPALYVIIQSNVNELPRHALANKEIALSHAALNAK